MLASEIEIARELERAGCGVVVRRPLESIKGKINQSLFRVPIERRKEVGADIASVALEHDVPVEDIFGRSRKRKVVIARHAAIRAVAKTVNLEPCWGNAAKFTWTADSIARLFNRDRTTILYVLDRITRKRKSQWQHKVAA